MLISSVCLHQRHCSLLSSSFGGVDGGDIYAGGVEMNGGNRRLDHGDGKGEKGQRLPEAETQQKTRTRGKVGQIQHAKRVKRDECETELENKRFEYTSFFV